VKFRETPVSMKMRPSIKIHSWGGFGSQLFTLLQYKNLRTLLPDRELQIIFHSSGVTRRVVEIQALLTDVQWLFIDDFREKSNPISFNRPYKTLNLIQNGTKRLIKLFLLKSGLIVELESRSDLSRIKPWTTSIRGHYSYFEYSVDNILSLQDAIEQLADKSSMNRFTDNSLLIQYRLGDLTKLFLKTYINPRIIDLEAQRIISNKGTYKKICILTDSPNYLSDLPLQFISSRGYSVDTLSPLQTIIAGMLADNFIGTNSKISLWIAIFRILSGKRASLPETFRNQLGYLATENLMHFYTLNIAFQESP
jgi:hypothetical protein